MCPIAKCGRRDIERKQGARCWQWRGSSMKHWPWFDRSLTRCSMGAPPERGTTLRARGLAERLLSPHLEPAHDSAHAPVSYTHLRAHETGRNLVCRLLLEKK